MPSHYEYLETCRKLAVLGGTFDPIHNGHISAAWAVLHELKPQKVLFLPTGMSPHKEDKLVSPASDRFQMVVRSIAGFPCFDTSRLEISKPGMSYTIDTARALKKILPPDGELIFVVGGDTIGEIPTWRDYTELLSIAGFAVVPRQGFDRAMKDIADDLRSRYGANIHVLNSPVVNVSSSEIRLKIKSGLPVSDLMPQEALGYAHTAGLYGVGSAALSAVRFKQVSDIIKERLSTKRFVHTLGTVEASEKLAATYGADVNKARWAALLHDCAKEYSSYKKHALCDLWAITLDDVLLESIDITHSLLGAEIAKRDFHINDEEILQAIRYHTTGHKHMSLLDKVVMLADYIEPYRVDYEPLNEMRRLAHLDIDKALIVGIKSTNRELKESGRSIHRWSKDALKGLKEMK